jgi:hypothetical protein
VTAKGIIFGLCLGSIAWITFLPRGWMGELDGQERRIVRWYLLTRAVLPLVTIFIGQRADRFFSGGSDADSYHNIGVRIADQLSAGSGATAHREVPGTGAIDLATGYFYAFAGPDRIASTYLATLASSIGLLLFWLATRPLVTEHRRFYALAILFAPTTLYWSSNLGKEAPVLLGLGAGVMGISLLVQRRHVVRAAFYTTACVVLTGFVRPHVTLLLGAALIIGLLFSRSEADQSGKLLSRILATFAAVVVVLVSLGLTRSLLNVSESDSLVDAAYGRAEVTSEGQGRSSYQADPVRSPARVPGAVSTVLFRPFIWESRTFFQVAAALEGMFLFVIFGHRIVPVLLRRRSPRLAMLVVSSGAFVVLLSSAIITYGNFGLIVRQKMQILPFFLLLVFAGTKLNNGRRISVQPNKESLKI